MGFVEEFDVNPYILVSKTAGQIEKSLQASRIPMPRVVAL